MKTIDLYIIRKFLGTFFYAITLLILIVIVFDFSERIDDFIDGNAPVKGIIFDYYLNFIPYFVNLFSPLFTFIAVIYFTSRMANNSEFLAILSSGVNLGRILLPYMISALVISLLSLYLNNYVIPHSNQKRHNFEYTFLKNPWRFVDRHIHIQLDKNVFAYFESYNNEYNTGNRFALEQFQDGELRSKLLADVIRWDSVKGLWQVENYYIRQINGTGEIITRGEKMDTALNLVPKDFGRKVESVETMNINELNRFIENETVKGSMNIPYYLIEKHRRFSFPAATIILTIIGLSIASRKVRGGTGLHLGMGLLIAFAYILFMQISTTFATNANLSPALAVWIPNFLYLIFALFLFRAAPQ
ncbi:MAG: LptF/LptG family permease [Bacteroidetes bacterium]|nr:LptF/LptG family permease [Bacteroidota bacterium]